MPDLEIIIPVLNEQDSVRELAQRVDSAMKSAGIKYGMVFVDDHSTDDTAGYIKKLQQRYPIILHKKEGVQGKAYAILEGVLKSSAPVLAMLDGDLQYPPEAIPEMYALLKTHGIVVANRKKENISKVRRVGSDASTRLVGKLLLGLDCDAQSGLKVFKREIIEELLGQDVKPWALDMPLLHTAREMGETIGAVEIEFKKRSKGHSKVNFVRAAWEITSTAVKLKLGARIPRNIAPKEGTMIGAGVTHKRRKFITHTTLPHGQSALYTLAGWQKWFVISMLAAVAFGFLFDYMATLIVILAILSSIYFADVLFSAYVLIKSLHFPPELKFSKKQIASINESTLPVYTILCPLYKEAKVLPSFIDSVKGVDWPKKKLEVLLLLEEDDGETLEACRQINLPEYIKVLVVPDSQPRTKPKACNFGLMYAKGEHIVVYDAEDRPDPLQLKKAYLGFKKLGRKVFCLQSKLNYYNPHHNILTRLFTAEYSLWFDVILPGLQSIESSIPLGGTSNHFRKEDLIALQAWDPFNVTEDCDLGVRIFKSGGKTAIIDSTTYEEANSSPRNWIRQRSRWIKGYMQTYLVHMREPMKFFRAHGIHAVLFQLIIGMRMSFMLINPFLWIMTVAYFAFRGSAGVVIEALYPAPVFYMAAFALVTGNFMYIYNYMIGCAKRGQWELIKYVFLIPFYWIMASIAAAKAFHQLLVKPHFWEKTHHGLHLKKAKSDEVKAATIKARLPVNIPFEPEYVFGLMLVFANVVANFLNFVTSAYLGRVLSAEEFGLIALMSSFLFLAQLPSSGLSQTLAHRSAFLLGKHGRPIGELWSVYRSKLLKISLVFVAIWLILSPLLATFFRSDTLIPFIVFAPMWTFFIAGAVDGAYIYGNMRFQWTAFLAVTEAIAKLVLSVLLVTWGLTNWVYAALPLSSGIVFFLTWLLAKRYASINQGHIKKASELRTSLIFPRKFFVTSILTRISSISFLSLDLVFVKHFLSAEGAGQYALLALVGRIIYMVSTLFGQFILPIVSKIEGSGEKSEKSFHQLFIAVLLSSTMAFVFLGPLGGVFVPALFGEKTLPILEYLVPFGVSTVCFSIAYSLVSYHQAKKEYIFAVPGILTLVVQAASLYTLRHNISQVVGAMLLTGSFFLLSTIILHMFFEKVKVLVSNIGDFLDLFLLKLNGKTRLPDGRLRILIYNWRDVKHVWAGGAEVYVDELAKRLVKDGHQVTIFCGNDGRNKRNEDIGGIKTYRRGGFYTVYLWAILYYLFKFRRRYDVIIESENGVPFFTPLYSTKPKILIVHHVHQEVFRRHLGFPLSVIAQFIESRAMPLVYRNIRIVAVSESTKSEMVKNGIAIKENVSVITPGVNLDSFRVQPKTSYPSFIYLGRHKAYKNIDIAIRAFRRVHEAFPDAKLVIAGEGELTEKLKKLAIMLKIRDSVYFPGKVDEEEKVRLLAKSWVSLQPSSFEGWGITVIEANACGTPVIASRVSGLKDSVVDGKTGVLIPERKISFWATTMIRLIKDEGFRSAASENALEWAKKFTWDDSANKMFNLIQNEAERVEMKGSLADEPV